jgi:hypothetical protein
MMVEGIVLILVGCVFLLASRLTSSIGILTFWYKQAGKIRREHAPWIMFVTVFSLVTAYVLRTYILPPWFPLIYVIAVVAAVFGIVGTILLAKKRKKEKQNSISSETWTSSLAT